MTAIEMGLSTLAGGPVQVVRRDVGGSMVLDGATSKLAAIVGFRATGRTFFTSAKVRRLLEAAGMTPTCEYPLDQDECGKPAVWTTDDLQEVHLLCDAHCVEALQHNDFISHPVHA